MPEAFKTIRLSYEILKRRDDKNPNGNFICRDFYGLIQKINGFAVYDDRILPAVIYKAPLLKNPYTPR